MRFNDFLSVSCHPWVQPAQQWSYIVFQHCYNIVWLLSFKGSASLINFCCCIHFHPANEAICDIIELKGSSRPENLPAAVLDAKIGYMAFNISPIKSMRTRWENTGSTMLCMAKGLAISGLLKKAFRMSSNDSFTSVDHLLPSSYTPDFPAPTIVHSLQIRQTSVWPHAF